MNRTTTMTTAALALGLALTATAGAQAETLSAPTTAAARIATAATGGDITAQQHTSTGVPDSHGARRHHGNPYCHHHNC